MMFTVEANNGEVVTIDLTNIEVRVAYLVFPAKTPDGPGIFVGYGTESSRAFNTANEALAFANKQKGGARVWRRVVPHLPATSEVIFDTEYAVIHQLVEKAY